LAARRFDNKPPLKRRLKRAFNPVVWVGRYFLAVVLACSGAAVVVPVGAVVGSAVIQQTAAGRSIAKFSRSSHTVRTMLLTKSSPL